MESTSKKVAVVNNAALEGKTFRDTETHAAIKDPTLRKNVKAFAQCETKAFAEMWKAARLLGEMTAHIKKDFGSDKAFAEYMGMTRINVNKTKRVAKFADECEAAGISVTKAFELLSLGSDEVIRANIIPALADKSQKEIREAVKDFKANKGQSADVNAIAEEIKEEKATTKESNKAARKAEKAKKAEKTTEEAENDQMGDNQYIVPCLVDMGNMVCMTRDVNIMLTNEQFNKLGELIGNFVAENNVKYELFD